MERNNHTPDFQEVRIADLTVDPRYQRALGPVHVEHILENFNPAALGAIAMSVRDDGRTYIVDGHHRWLACRRRGLRHMDALVFEGLSSSEEADLFLKFNFSKMVTPGIKYKARILIGDPQALAIKATVEMCGLTLDPNKGASATTVSGIAKLDRIYTNWGVGMIRVFWRSF